MIANKEQLKIINEGVNFYLNSSEQVFQIDGEAGTGKSFVLNEIAKRLNFKMTEILPMAYIGQAALVMRTKGMYTAKSIHSSIYEPVEEIDTSRTNTVFNRPILKTVWKLKDLSNYKALFIDEGWMVPDGKIKNDLLSTGLKIFVAGDSGQLPPIDGNPAFLTSGKVHHLIEPMRQSLNSPILYLAKRARHGLPIDCGLYGNNALVIEERDLNDRMLSIANSIICYRNNTRDSFNKYIRENIYHHSRDIPSYGDRVICRKNNWNAEVDGISLANGLVGTVCNEPSPLLFDGITFHMDFLPDLLNTPFLNVSCDYNYFTGNSETRRKIKNDQYSVGEKFEFAYASTAHLSQGSEYPVGIYIEEECRNNIFNQINYVGITRFKQGLIYVKKGKKIY